METTTLFKKGTFLLNKDPNFNYQLNRTYTWSDGDLNELVSISDKIVDSQSWEEEMLKLAEKAIKENRIKHAIAYYRMAEFFMYDGNPKKIETYDKSISLFYDYNSELFNSGIIHRDSIPFNSISIPVLYTKPKTGKYIDTILLHGGYDSYMEEFINMMLYLREKGFQVYLFEGPGQGSVLRKSEMTFLPEWELPVEAILDFYNLNDVTIVGLSLGAMLAPRAAAFEKRIKRVVAWSLFPNFLDVVLLNFPQKSREVIKSLMSNQDYETIDHILYDQMKVDHKIEWAINHGMHNMGVDAPHKYLLKLDEFQYLNVSDNITQDFLLLGAEKDHFLPVELYKPIIDCLKNVNSLTFRLFTEKESAENHCNAGNAKLALDTIISWIKNIKIPV